MKIYALKGRTLNEEERLTICKLLIKAGYSVRIGKEADPNKKTRNAFIEFWEGENA